MHMIMLFGNQDTLSFLGDTPINDHNGRPLCLMAKTTVHSLFVPLLLSREHVWGLLTGRDPKTNVIQYRTGAYLPIAKGDIAKFQASGRLPNPLPPMSYKVWQIIAVCFGWFVILAGLASILRH